ncbi:hypothetical protein [Streptomyces sp. NPDC094472]|uniref:hypothetical protein n=1 Tax=Streptomyces sp. NPDC094472 TaxID=3155080 RepID=UPI0033218342
MLGDGGLALYSCVAPALPLGGALVTVEAGELVALGVGRLLEGGESVRDFRGRIISR